ncbi:MAG: TolC family protein [Bacteroidales bacterium]|nr:TolC family protein [Bacteroidales bacterium]MCI1785176.1 TolC family protein [Bacteroidales bacterium]
MNLKVYLLLFLSMSSFEAFAQDTLHLTLKLCRELAVESSKTIKIANETIDKAQGEKIAARSARFPDISASAYGLYHRTSLNKELYLPTQVFDPSTGKLTPNVVVDASGHPVIGSDGNPIFNTYAYLPINLTFQGGGYANISAEQPIYAGGKITSGNKMADIGKNMAYLNKTLKTSDVIYETDKAYYLYLSVKGKVKLAEKYKNLLSELVKTVNDSYETGMVNRNELLKVKVRYNDACLQLQRAESGFKLAGMSLCRLIGVPLKTPLSTSDSLDFTMDTTGFLNASSQNRAEYQILKEQMEMAGENIKMVKGKYLPTVGVSVGYSALRGVLKNMNDYTGNGMNVMATIKIPITTFGEGRGKIRAAKADYNIRKLELQDTQDMLQLENEQALLNLTDAGTRVRMAKEALEQADENMKVSDDNYEVGMETIVNVLDAKAQWQEEYSSLIDAFTEYKIQQSNYLRITNHLKAE